ncbi:induced myeloid leukemia cell differentiation protein Mcl-1 homolog [Brienomyrus brachyistius]|uniref:induced myeloid leukemia cell differentiation protein Mcl-1 homolog n=1 Tax=Brienomyrus brachyistius TaxID=42636 RepID=UPI0020B38D38|nr:induced myeloid leukemia cell differentiation protein Mcl-1 homolog [Brienomyrus brachyistius]
MNLINRTTATGLFCPGIKNGVKQHSLFPFVSAPPVTLSKTKSEEELDSLDDGDLLRGPSKPERRDCELRLRASGNEDGSLPPTPGTPPDYGRMPTFPNEVLNHETQDLIETFLRIYSGLPASSRRHKAYPVLKRVAEKVIEKHMIAYNGMIKKLQLDKRGDDTSFVTTVAMEIFSDNVTNWGRIVSLIAFGGVVCKYLKDHGQGDCVNNVADQISCYLLQHQRDWLNRNNGWEGFINFFYMDDPESTVRNALVAFAGVASLGAGLALLMR